MDEPTAALGVKETALVLNLVRKLREEGRTVILISHNMADVVALADRVAILKSGIKVIERDVAGLDADVVGAYGDDGQGVGPRLASRARRMKKAVARTDPAAAFFT
jgi:ABC-type sugar transport system ATPase subunit